MTETSTMPASSSFEDISTSPSASSLRSSASLPGSGSVGGPATYSHLPDYMAMYHLDSPSDDKEHQQQLQLQLKGKQQQQQQAHHQHPLKVNRSNRASINRQPKTYQQQQQANDWPATWQSGGRRGSYQSSTTRPTSYHQQFIELPQVNTYCNDYYYYGIDEDEMDNIRTLQHNTSNTSSSSSSGGRNGGGIRRTRAATETETTTLTPNNLTSMITFTDDRDDQLATCIQNLNSKESFLATTMTPPTHQHYLTLEELKMAHSSCWLCGCNWQQDHVSLDCQECGGYALTRPCPKCDGKCKQVWERDIALTHDHQRASWAGQCLLQCPASQAPSASLTNSGSTKADASSLEPLVAAMIPQKPSLASSCCSSQSSSAASSDCE